MITWVLIIILQASHGDGLTTLTVPNFITQEECLAGGEVIWKMWSNSEPRTYRCIQQTNKEKK